MANYDLTYEGSRVQGILDTGDELRDAGYIFRGEATPSTVPGTPTERVAYIGGPGTYTNFGSSITVGAGCICVFKYTGSAWSNQVIDTGLSDAISSEATTRSEADTALQSAITAINNNIGNGYVYAGVATPSTSPVTGKVFYLAVTAGTYTNFGNAVVTAGLNVLKYNGSAWSVDQIIAIDAEPTQGSDHLVKSGGVLNSIIQNGPAFDLSAYNAQGGTLATYADLSAALTALNALPADFKKGGMSIKFVQSSDNNYIQARLMADSFTTDVTQWQLVDTQPIPFSKNLIESGAVAGIQTEIDGVTKREITFTSSYTAYYVPLKKSYYIGYKVKNTSRNDAYIRIQFVDDNDNVIATAGDKLIASGNTFSGSSYHSEFLSATKINFSKVFGNNFDIEVDLDDAIEPKISGLQKKVLYEVVDANGKGDYSTLEEAIYDNISDRNNPLKHRTIIVMPGAYTMNTYYGNTAHYWDVISNRNLSIIGVDRNACILKNTKGKYVAGSNRIDDACLKLSGNVLIKNLTLLASHENFDGAEGTTPLAYCIHLDSGGADCNLEVDNCIMVDKQSACIGIGTADNYTIQIRNCKMITNVDNPEDYGSWNGAVICHNANYSNPATLRLENNIMKSNTPNTLCITRNGSYTSGIKLEAYRNIISGNVSLDLGIVTLDELSWGNNKSELNYQS